MKQEDLTTEKIIKFGKALEAAEGSVAGTGGTKTKTDPRSIRDTAVRGVSLKGVTMPGSEPVSMGVLGSLLTVRK